MIGQLVGEIVKISFVTLVFLAFGFALEFNWFFWLLVLFYILRPYIDALTNRLNNLKNRPPH